MTIYNVLAPPARAGTAEPDPARFVFVKEGFCWPAFYMTAIWLVSRRMWLVLMFYAAAVIALFLLVAGMPPPPTSAALVLFAILVGMEANNLRRWTLESRGYRFLGLAQGERVDDAELRFFANWQNRTESPAPARPLRPAPIAPPEPATVIGLFPSPGEGR